jgi:hypothetical protein
MESKTLLQTAFNYTRLLLLLVVIILASCTSGKQSSQVEPEVETLVTKSGFSGIPIKVEFIRGTAHNHPLMAVWLEDLDGNYLETLYVSESIGTGVFGHGKVTDGHWEPGPVRRPAALPYWWHKWGVLPDESQPVPDAITGPTPKADFILMSNADPSAPQKFRILMEINQSWDWNEYWTNDKYPDNADYKTSSQPAIVYEAFIDLSEKDTSYFMKAVGHSHYAGENGKLFEDITSLTTARNIAGVIKVSTVQD